MVSSTKNRRQPAPAGLPADESLPAGESLQDEIAALRALMRAMKNMLLDENASLPETRRSLAAFGRAGVHLASLLKAQRLLQPGDEAAGLINQALAEVITDLEQAPPRFGRRSEGGAAR